jgi:hypothetical protein
MKSFSAKLTHSFKVEALCSKVIGNAEFPVTKFKWRFEDKNQANIHYKKYTLLLSLVHAVLFLQINAFLHSDKIRWTA